ncbi:hypothetical protein [Brevundimonas sp.]|jgi:hypothetical protein|uniref:hypothetical protein n=1 Tax=Brevundimonas sp. TaxID=1871086 RepID=UPI002E115F3A|nr:hypothetical protein [Brevundimonas sp.]
MLTIAGLALGLLICPEPSAEMMALGLHEFDQTEVGWRSLDEEGCEAIVADVIARYRTLNAQALVGQDIGTLDWHEGQLRAAASQTDRAIDIMTRSREVEGDPAIQLYIDATLAFLRQDRPALIEARARLVALPMPDGYAQAIERFKRTYPDLPPPVWPLNLDVVDGLIACFDKPYAEAYACRPETL